MSETETSNKRTGGEKFVSKYGVKAASAFKGDTASLKIPGKDHPLYDPTAPTTFDPLRVEAIDRDGTMTTPIEVYTDPDNGTLWVLDGRGRLLDVREVNRRRAEEKRELVEPYLVTFKGDEKAAVARVREKNYHRRSPTRSGMALDLLALRNKGYDWAAACRVLHLDSKDPEQFGRGLLPLAYCIPEVREAIDSGELPATSIKRFGGSLPDGSKALSKTEQKELLTEFRAKAAEPKVKHKAVSMTARKRAAEALTNGETENLNKHDKELARFAAALLERLDSGKKSALSDWPEVAHVLEAAIKPAKRGPKATKEKAE